MDDDEETTTEQTHTHTVVEKSSIEPIVKVTETRQWSQTQDKPEEVRQWNIDKTKFNHKKKGPFQRKHNFKSEHTNYEKTHFRGYSFKDDVVENESIKPPSPVYKDIHFPKLTESSPSSDVKKTSSEVQTFAEKIKLAMEKEAEKPKEEKEKDKESKNTLHMYSVIPMKTKLGDSLQFLS